MRFLAKFFSDKKCIPVGCRHPLPPRRPLQWPSCEGGVSAQRVFTWGCVCPGVSTKEGLFGEVSAQLDVHLPHVDRQTPMKT